MKIETIEFNGIEIKYEFIDGVGCRIIDCVMKNDEKFSKYFYKEIYKKNKKHKPFPMAIRRYIKNKSRYKCLSGG